MTTTNMGPPPPRNTTTATTTTTSTSTSTSTIASTSASGQSSSTTEDYTKMEESPSPAPSPQMKKTPMGPPPPLNPNPPNTEPDQSEKINDRQLTDDAAATAGNSTIDEDGSLAKDKKEEQKPPSNVAGGGVVAVPYTIPPWSEPPCHNYFLEVLKDGSIIDQFDVYEKGAYMFGRVDLCDFVLEHPTISRFHAVLQFNKSGGAFLYDLSSTHGTFINKNQVEKKVYVELHVGDVIRFGHSSRLYIFQGPSDLMLPEGDLKSIRNAKMRAERRDMEASLSRAKREAALADGISWGMDEDAIEENEDDVEEITWQTFKGQLTEKQEKTREKVLKRLEKIANMKKEIDAIRAKDIAQGGLTQGQQTQIARNEQRMSQVAEELENLEETLNESIRESMGARGGRLNGKKKGATQDDEDEYYSDEDEFYDRTRKKPSKQKENQSVETAGSLLDKKDAISKEIEEKKKMLDDEKNKVIPENEVAAEAGDALDAFMSGLSSQLVQDKTSQLQKELDALQSELERILYLLKIADPTGEAARRRQSTAGEGKPNASRTSVVKKPLVEKHTKHGVEENSQREATAEVTTKPSKSQEEPKVVADATEGKSLVYTVNKPQWLGAVEIKEAKKPQEAPVVSVESDQFVDYKDRKEILGKKESPQVNLDLGLENAAPGLIIRKRKQVEDSDKNKDEVSDNSSAGVEIAAEDAVALLLKHTRGIQASDDDDEVRDNGERMAAENRTAKGKKKAKKVLGPDKPSFLNSETDYESWVPPEGQSGDGRTSLNDRFGY